MTMMMPRLTRLSSIIVAGVLLLSHVPSTTATLFDCSKAQDWLGEDGIFNPFSHTVTNITYYPAKTFLNITNVPYNLTTNVLPAFCRIELNLTTSPTSDIHTEVWLPDANDWNGRLLGTGVGGLAGGVQLGDLGNNGINLGFATFGTDTGHSSTTNDGSWGLNNPEGLIDFGYRAMHVSVIVAKLVTTLYYGKAANKSYYLSCSTGGRQGLKEVEMFPEDFDGVVIGSPANWQTHLQPWGLRMAAHVQPVNGSTWLDAGHWSLVHDEVLRQCDLLDGVADGIINDPRRCFFRPETLACRPAQNTSLCLTTPQIGALKQIYSDWRDVNNTYVFGGYQPGGENTYFAKGLVGVTPFPIAGSYMQNMVYNTTQNITYVNSTYDDMLAADAADPGQQNAMNPDLRPFVGRKGKLLHYVGWADHLIAPTNSLYYYSLVQEFMNTNTNYTIDDYYRFFPVGGMTHCRGGDGANSFGNQGLAYAAPYSDSTRNILMAMVDWVEKDVAPERLVATKFNGDYPPLGVNFTRPICKFPTSVVWDGQGSIWNETSFKCV